MKFLAKLTLIILLLVVSSGVFAQTVTIATDKPSYKVGEKAAITAAIKNDSVATAPFTVTGNALYTSVTGVIVTSTGVSAPITVKRVISVEEYSSDISSQATLVTGSAKVDGILATPVISGNVITIPINKTLPEQQVTNVTYTIQTK